MFQQLLTRIHDKLDPAQPMPLYLQLKQLLTDEIKSKALPHGTTLPSERKMAQALGLSRVTIVKALAELLELGLIIKRQGKGTQINSPVSYHLAHGGFSSQLQKAGNVSNRWLVRERQAASEPIANALRIPSGAIIAKIKRVRLVDNLPVSIETMYIPEVYLPRPELLEGSLYSYWSKQGLFPDIQDYSLNVHMPTQEERTLLEMKELAPLMRIVLTSRDKTGHILEHGHALCLSDYFNFDFKVKVIQTS